MRIVRPDRMLVVALSEAAEIGRAIMADGFERQFSEALLNFAALDLEQARFRSRRSEEHTSELQSLMRISYAVFCLKKKRHTTTHKQTTAHSRKTKYNYVYC